MRDALLLLLILALAVGWFSTNGPMDLPDERGLGPGTDRAGESPLVVSGPGAETVVASESAEPAETEVVETPGGGSAWEEMTVTVTEEVERMEPFLMGCMVGGALVLVGVFASPTAAWLWDRICKK